jgi:hypothetical protein
MRDIRQALSAPGAMTIQLELKPEIEAGLAARARAKGIPLEAYVLSVIEELVLVADAPRPSLAEFRETLDALAHGADRLPVLPPEAFSRESIYTDPD